MIAFTGTSALRRTPANTAHATRVTAETKHKGREESDCGLVSKGRRRQEHDCWYIKHGRMWWTMLMRMEVNLALSFARRGYKAGILDTDIFGPSIPTLLNLSGEPRLSAS
jgi:hypothetical protein